MSSQRGNAKKTRPQKHQNTMAFKNNLHDTSHQTKHMNSIEVAGCCSRCTEVIEWKIKYKKYKPLTVPRKCVRCSQKTVKLAYCIVCQACSEENKVCAKCGKDKEIVKKMGLSVAEEASKQAELNQQLRGLSERQRRSFFRAQASGSLTTGATAETDSHSRPEGDSDSDEPQDEEIHPEDPTVDEEIHAENPTGENTCTQHTLVDKESLDNDPGDQDHGSHDDAAQ